MAHAAAQFRQGMAEGDQIIELGGVARRRPGGMVAILEPACFVAASIRAGLLLAGADLLIVAERFPSSEGAAWPRFLSWANSAEAASSNKLAVLK